MPDSILQHNIGATHSRGDTVEWSHDDAAKPSPHPPELLFGQIHNRLDEQRARFLADLEQLVNLDSGTYDRDDVMEVNRWLHRRLAHWHGSERTHPSTEFADSFAITLSGTGAGNVLLLGHFDTVFPHGTAAARGFRIEADRALGPGTCDMKGGLLAAIYAVEALESLHFDQYRILRCVFTSD